MEESNQQQDLVQQFIELTGAAPVEATQYLTANKWDLSSAATEYYTAMEEGSTGNLSGVNDEQEPLPYNGPRTLDGRPAPASSSSAVSSSRASAPRKKKGGIATLSSLNEGNSSDENEQMNDYDHENPEANKDPRDLFTGGAKSGLAVQDPSQNRSNPKNIVRDIVKMAQANHSKPQNGTSTSTQTRFRGNGQTLGGEDTPSQVIPSNEQRTPEMGHAQTRTLHLWLDGFSIEDGPLRRFDDPQNAADLEMIRQGRAPFHMMGALPNQLIDVQLVKHDENYKAPPKVYKPFSGSGNRLGSPVPGAALPAVTATATPSTIPEAPSFNLVLDPSQPSVTLRIQLADGTRLPVRFNLSHSIGHVYEVIERASTNSSSRPWVLATTFPNKNHDDKSLTLGDIPEFKKGGTAVQKFV
ncbi:hypothetical protein K3495_g2788 [Podosphaera aphanis]|nr:hypothetical protein K3495_g2788 [Podosphaera aphanis]